MVTRAAGLLVYRRLHSKIEYLLLQTSYGKHHWTPPKGHVDPGEDLLTTAYRETMEEAGLLKEHLKLHEDMMLELTYMVRNKQKISTYWPAELVDNRVEVVLSDEHQDFKWLELHEACAVSNFADMQDMLMKIDKYLKR